MRQMIIALVAISTHNAWAEPGQITWSVANGFQVFKNDSDFQRLKQAWKPGMSAQDFLSTQNSKSLREILPIDATWWNPSTGTYDEDGLFKDRHNVILSLSSGQADQACQWRIDEVAAQKQKPCSEPISFLGIKENTDFTISVSVDGAAPITSASQRITTKLILGIGDSYSSGEGNPDHAAVITSKPLPGQPPHISINTLSWIFMGNYSNRRFIESAKWWDTACHRSMLSWQSMYAMKLAVNDEHSVVRFASFACSGAETYDGFFRAQQNPPVNTGSERVVRSTFSKTQLNKSQLNSAVELLCDGATSAPTKNEYRKGSQFGKFTAKSCQGKLRTPDLLLAGFGGNDFGFAGVVTYGVFPRNSVNTGISSPIMVGLKNHFLGLGALFKGAEDPIEAGRKAKSDTPYIYEDMNKAFAEYLEVSPTRVVAMVYPDPLPVKSGSECKDRMTQGNESLSEMIGEKWYLSNKFIFQIEQKESLNIKNNFIAPLQHAQRVSMTSLGWKSVEAQRGFESREGVRTLCATTVACSGKNGACEIADLVGWRKAEDTRFPSALPLPDITAWESYTPAMTRGIRLFNDAALTQARFVNKSLQEDWINGAFHPTAQVHAGIADAIR